MGIIPSVSLFIPTVAESALIVVDLQPSFLKAIHEADRVLHRSEFLVRVASILEVPVLATVQNPERMGGPDERVAPYVLDPEEGKMAFSCAGCGPLMSRLQSMDRGQAILVGIETHICVSQTAHHLLDQGFEVAVCADAVGARSEDRHQIGLERIRMAGTAIAHTESIAYEWMGGADHPKFKEVLEVVKAFSP
jgi:nicotinamidase-related amidase